jgi:mannose-6-phosphate isomerase
VKKQVEKVWGKDILPYPFTVSGTASGTASGTGRIGEIWFEPLASMPSILVKYIFTSEKLSVQVHPNDAQALAFGEADQGKEECWLVLEAEPGATLGIGFRAPLDNQAMHKAACDGTIEALMEWYPVSRGDFFYIPAGTVHAIGAGVSLIEIQQNSDITYRLYDYGRPRELHLDKGIAVAAGEPYNLQLRKNLENAGTVALAQGPYFWAWHIADKHAPAFLRDLAGPFLLVPLQGTVEVAGDHTSFGECIVVNDLASAAFSGACLVITSTLNPA